MQDGEPDLSSIPALRRWAGFAAMCTAMFMAVLDIQIVITSLTVIEEALQIGAEHMSWVQTAYLIAEVIAIPLTGLLIRVFGLRVLVAGATSLFTLASIGCAVSAGFCTLVTFRIVQGLAGGVLIPAVFAAIFLLFRPGREQTIATTLAGMLAVLAPALGPIGGGYITEYLSWHWLFLVNVVPGILTAAVAAAALPRAPARLALFKALDLLSLAAIAAGLAALEIGLKEAPDGGWTSAPVLGLFAACLVLMGFAVARPEPAVPFRLLRDRNLGFGCAISFVLGVGLYGSVYLLPVFLSFVRHQGPVEIGTVLLATGAAQLVAAPISVWLDTRYGARLLSAIGFTLFAAGLAMSAFDTRSSGFSDLLLPQVVRGAAIGLCILPVTRFALGLLPLAKVSDASGLYNLSRNLGGAIGIALIDTVLFTRSGEHASELVGLIKTAPADAAEALGLGLPDLPDPEDPLGLMAVMDIVQEAALTLAINDAWLMLAGVTVLALILLWALGPIRLPDGHVPQRKATDF